MKKNRVLWIVVLLILIAICLMLLPTNASAEGDKPYDEIVPHVLGFEIPTGQYCVTDYRDGKAFTQCFCACETCAEPSVIPKEVPPTDSPTQEPTAVPTDKPKDTPVPTSAPTEKPKCNSGRGNGSEGEQDCDPGNSGKNQGGD